MTVTVLRADARNLPLADASVDLIVTSPPYWALRSYTDTPELCARCRELTGQGWEYPRVCDEGRDLRQAWPDWDAHVKAEHKAVHYDGQIGAEATPAAYVDSLIECTREWMRVLKPSGSCWVNLGDKYSTGNSGQSGMAELGEQYRGGGHTQSKAKTRSGRVGGMPPKSLIGLPWRYAIRCIDDLGLILRAEVIWCLSGGARVYARTPTGDRPIMLRDLVRHYRPEDVHLWNGTQWTRVRGWNRTPDDDGALELELRTGERIGCTPNHQWPTDRGLLRADEIRVGDVITTTRLPARGLPRFPSALPDDDIGWLIGLYIAEGSRSETTIQFAGHVREDSRHERLARIAEAYDGTSAVYQTSENGVTCNLRGSVLVGIINRYVSEGTAKTKRLRHAAWQRSDTFLAAVVDGYLSGDGHYDAKNDRWRLGFTANDEWAADLRTLAARLGTVLRLRRAVHNMAGRPFPGWRGEWRWTRSAHGNAKRDGEVIAIRRSRARDFYDLGVADEPHLFALASGVLTHNSKPNGLPESVTDRVRRSHETWFHLTKSPRYFSAVDAIREAHAGAPDPRGAGWTERMAAGEASRRGEQRDNIPGIRLPSSPLGKLPGSVWTIATQPLKVPAELGVDHFAAFPMEWPRRIIQGWSPSGICTACGEGRRPVVTHTGRYVASSGSPELGGEGERYAAHHAGNRQPIRTATGWSLPKRELAAAGEACACPDTSAPTRPAVVLDPFGGTGTTALVAHALGRHGVSADMSADYCRLAEWRTQDPGQLAAALEVPRPAPVHVGQLDLFGAAS